MSLQAMIKIYHSCIPEMRERHLKSVITLQDHTAASVRTNNYNLQSGYFPFMTYITVSRNFPVTVIGRLKRDQPL